MQVTPDSTGFPPILCFRRKYTKRAGTISAGIIFPLRARAFSRLLASPVRFPDSSDRPLVDPAHSQPRVRNPPGITFCAVWPHPVSLLLLPNHGLFSRCGVLRSFRFPRSLTCPGPGIAVMAMRAFTRFPHSGHPDVLLGVTAPGAYRVLPYFIGSWCRSAAVLPAKGNTDAQTARF